ncbi:HMG box protein [Aspergillus sclerotialis]|uniref:HMG box protein n=1 Tax=Aspergillus sclerotialis TaxID=2070753 RepID=A0A3A2ZI43_9EURO|nr:HMG box protein [Aspergillus sclerotialis]
MPLNLAYRGGALLRTVRPNVLCRSARVAAIHTPAKRVSLATTGRLSKLPVGVAYPSSVLRVLTKSYATAGESEGSSEKSTGKRKASKTSKGGKKKKKSASSASKKPKKPKRKGLTPRQKSLKAAKERRDMISRLKETALQPPKKRTVVGPSLILREIFTRSKEDPNRTKPLTFMEAQEIARTYSEEEREKFRRLAKENKAANDEDYRNFINSHSPREIKDANVARRALSRITKKKVLPLRDDRLVKKAVAAQNFLYNDLLAAGELEGLRPQETIARVSQRFRELTDAEREKYLELQARDRERFEREYLEVYGQTPAPTRSKRLPKSQETESKVDTS